MKETEAKILIVEDEKSLREVIKILLEEEGYAVCTAKNGTEGIEWLGKDIFDLIITDIKMPGADGFQILKKTMEVSPESLVIMITAFGTTEAAIEAMKLGAFDYIHKPFKIDEIRLIVKSALDKKRLKTEVTILREKVKTVYRLDNILGKSPQMQEILRLIPKVAQGMSSVLITGESGTGKELVANALHNFSGRADKNFIAINCASLPEGLLESELFGYMKGSFTGANLNKQGLFEAASGGTLFLDELAEMTLNLQSKLLRAIETGAIRRIGGIGDIKVDVRILAATNRDLNEEVAAGRFREDLFYRLNVIPIRIPPLRERREDIPLYIDYFLKKYSDGKRQFSARALNLMVNHEWKGNVREIENVIERMILFAERDIIMDSDLPAEFHGAAAKSAPEFGKIDLNQPVDLEAMLEGLEKGYLLEALRLTEGKKKDAADLLKLSFRSLRHRLLKYGIK